MTSALPKVDYSYLFESVFLVLVSENREAVHPIITVAVAIIFSTTTTTTTTTILCAQQLDSEYHTTEYCLVLLANKVF
jgi:hypothetical protein